MCFGVVIKKSYEDMLNFEYGISKFDSSHFQCPMVTHLYLSFSIIVSIFDLF